MSVCERERQSECRIPMVGELSGVDHAWQHGAAGVQRGRGPRKDRD